MATSIDKSVNWRNAAAAPDYQVTAKRVDTFVQGERNTKGEQIAAALDSAAGTVSQVGKKKLQQKRQAQAQALDSSVALMQEQAKKNKDYNYLDDPLFKGHPEVMRIQIAQALGKNTKEAFDAEGNAITFAGVEDYLSENPDVILDEKGLSDYLSTLSVPVDAEDSYNIHRQASQSTTLEVFKDKIKAQGVGKRKERDIQEATFTYEQGLLEAFNSGETDAEKWEKATAFDQGFKGLANWRRQQIQFTASKDWAIANKNATFLREDTVPMVFKNSSYDAIRRGINDRLEDDNRSEERWQMTKDEHTKTENLRSDKIKILKRMDTGEFVQPSEFTDPQLRAFVQTQNRIGFVEPNKSVQNKERLVNDLIDSSLSTEPLKIGDKIYPKTFDGYTDYIYDIGGMNGTDVQEALKQVKSITAGVDLKNTTAYKGVFDVVTPRLGKIYGSDKVKKAWIAETKSQLEKEFIREYTRLKNDDDGFTIADQEALEITFINRADKLVGYRNDGVEPPKDDEVVDPNADGVKSLTDKLFGDGDTAEVVSEDQPEVTSNTDKVGQTPSEVFVNLPEEELIGALVQTPSLSFEQIDGLTPEEMLEIYPEEIEKAVKQLQANDRFRDMLGGLFNSTSEEPKGLTQAQQAYFDKTGKLPASAQTK
jgi:hypothetical protein